MKPLLYLLMLIAVVWSSCTHTQEVVGEGQADEQGYLSITVNLPTFVTDASTRAGVAGVAHDETYTGTLDEQKVTAARVVFYEIATHTVKHYFDLTASDVVSGVFTAPKFTIKAREMRKQRFDVLMLLNPTAKVKVATEVGKSKSDFEDVAEEALRDLTSAGGLFMCNAQGYVRTTELHWRYTAEEAEKSNISLKVPVERAVAKVFVAQRQGERLASPQGVATMNYFALDVVNKQLFWMRKPGLALTANGTADTPAPMAEETAQTPQKYQYAIDPNPSALAAPRATAFDYMHLGATTPRSTGGYDDAQGVYVTENTMEATAQQGLGATRLVFNLVYVPTALKDKLTAEKHWANYRGKYLTKAELLQKLEEARTKTDDEMQMPHGFKAMAPTLRQKDYSRSFDEDGLQYYHNGENYYASYIRHFDDAKQPLLMAYGRYGVVRNHIYKIYVNEVSGPGSPIVPPPTAEPLDKTKTYISIAVTVAPWSVVGQGAVVLD